MKPIKIDNKPLGKYSISPYNFISLPETTIARYKDIKDLPSHDSFKNDEGKKLLKGSIEYTLEAKTPIIVSKGSDEGNNAKFFKNTSGEYAIPGNTIRGMIRTNSQILSYSNVADEIEDSRYLYRDIAGNNVASKSYSNFMNIDQNKRIAKNIKVGYIYKTKKDYKIKPSKELTKGIPYYRVDELKLRERYLDKDFKDMNFLFEKGILEEKILREFNEQNKIIGKAKNKYSEECRVANKKITKILKEFQNKQYMPYYSEISFNLVKNKVSKVGKKDKYKYNGYILSGGDVLYKRSHYIIPGPEDNSGDIKIDEKWVREYINDGKRTNKIQIVKGKIKPKKGKSYFMLPKAGEIKPVFYIKLGEDMHFGFTPNLRIMYGKSVLDGLPENYNNVDGVSCTDSIFGFSNMGNNNTSYKSRVSFQDAVVDGNAIIDSDSIIDILLAEPKPTSYNLYLDQKLSANKKNLDIYENDFKIRGIKQYWLKEYIEDPKPNTDNRNMISKIYPLKEGTKFKGKIHFENLEKDELGLLLWSLRLEENCYQNIGLAKPYGFGRVKVKDINLKLEDLDKKYSSFTFDYKEKADEDKFINVYKKEFSEVYLNGKNIVDEKPIKELIKIKTKIIKEEDSNYYRYMEMRKKEFDAKRVLPEILEYENEIKKKFTSRSGKGKTNNDNRNNNKKKDSRKNTRNKRNNSFGNKMDLSDWNKK